MHKIPDFKSNGNDFENVLILRNIYTFIAYTNIVLVIRPTANVL
jgi:hypothetical protein